MTNQPKENPMPRQRRSCDLDDADRLLLPSEAADLLGCYQSSLARWANAGYLKPVRTLGGHRRYRLSEVNAVIAAGFQPQVAEVNGVTVATPGGAQ